MSGIKQRIGAKNLSISLWMLLKEGGGGFTRSIPETPWGPSGKEITVKILNAPTVATSTIDMIKKAPVFGSLSHNSQEQLERFMHNHSYTGMRKWYMNRY